MTPAGARAAGVRISRSPEETEAIGAALAPALTTGDVVVLRGPLGVGKTRLVAGLARGLGVGRVRSPSFTLVHEHAGRVPLVHVDLYRIDERDPASLGLEEALERGALVVEWGEKLPAWLRDEALEVRIEILGEAERRLVADAVRGRGLALLEAWRRAVAESGP